MEKTEDELIVDPRLNIFDKSKHDQSVLACNVVHYYPLSQLSPSANVIEFNISGEGENYIDTSNIKLKISGTLKEVGGAKDANVKDGVANNLLFTLISQIDVSYNDRLLTESTNTFAYISYIRALLETSNDEKSGKLQSQLFYPDSYSTIDSNLPTANSGLAKRMEFTKPNNKVEMIGTLPVDVLSCPTFLMPGVSIRVKLYLNRPEFYIVSSNVSCKAAFIIDTAALLVPKITLKSEVIISHSEILKQQPALYQYHKMVSRVHTMAARSRSTTIESLFSDRIPSLVVVAMVSSADFSGSYSTNPFYFRHCNLRSISLVLNGQAVPSNPVECDFSSAKSTNATLFNNFTDAITKHFNIRDSGVEMKYFYKGYTLALFDLSDSAAKTRSGELRLIADFTSELEEPVTMIILGRFPSKIYINESRVVSHDLF